METHRGPDDKVGLKDKPGEILEHGMEGGRGAGTRRPGNPSPLPDPGLLGFYTVLGRTWAVFGSFRSLKGSVQVALLMGPGMVDDRIF